jgi:hypothetical protein
MLVYAFSIFNVGSVIVGLNHVPGSLIRNILNPTMEA